MSVEAMEVDEDLPNFFEALLLSEADKVIAENQQMMSEFGFELVENDLIEKLEHTRWPEKAIQGTPWYSIMSNPVYVEAFAWLGPHVKDRGAYIKDADADGDNNHLQSDVVSVLMNLGSIPDYVASRFIICNDFNIGFMGLMDEYKKDFFEKHGRPWAYSNPKLIDEYVGFKRARESFQRDYADQKEGGHIEMQEMR